MVLLQVLAWRNASAPNVLLCRHALGLSAFHLFSGRLLARLPLADGALHLDADGDGLVEAFGLALPVQLRPDDGELLLEHRAAARCEGTVRVGLPASRPAAPVPLCHHLADAQRVGLSGAGPAFVPPLERKSTPLLAYLLSSGEVVVADARRDRRALPPPIRVATPASWGQASKGRRYVGISQYGPTKHVLVVGDAHLAIVNPGKGHVLGSVALREPAISEPVVAHLDGDSHWDLVVTTASTVTVYRVRPERASRLFGFVVLALVFVLGVLAFVFVRDRK